MKFFSYIENFKEGTQIGSSTLALILHTGSFVRKKLRIRQKCFLHLNSNYTFFIKFPYGYII